MRKKKLIIFLDLLIFAFSCNAKIYYEYRAEGGKFVFNWFHSYIGYDKVYEEYLVIDGHQVRRINCYGAGNERCCFHDSGQSSIHGTYVDDDCLISSDFLIKVNNDIIAEIENQIVSDGKCTKNLDRIISTRTVDGRDCFLSFSVKYEGYGQKSPIMMTIVVDELPI